MRKKTRNRGDTRGKGQWHSCDCLHIVLKQENRYISTQGSKGREKGIRLKCATST